MTAFGTCATCGKAFTRPTAASVADAIWACDIGHRRAETPIVQLPQVTFREQALTAIRALAVTGKPFTIGEAHPMVDIPPINPRTDWENARKEAERLGWVTWTGEYTDSVVPTSKRSAVKVWRGTSKAARTEVAFEGRRTA